MIISGENARGEDAERRTDILGIQSMKVVIAGRTGLIRAPQTLMASPFIAADNDDDAYMIWK